MEQTNDTALFLDLLNGPAFSVKDGLVDRLNGNAVYLAIQPGTSVMDLIRVGAEEYEALEQGRLFLSLELEGVPFGASVSRMNGWDLFVLEPPEHHAELAALELASRELRGPMGDLKMLSDLLLPKLDKKYDPLAGSMNHSIFRLLRILNNMSNAYDFSDPTRCRKTELHPGILFRNTICHELAPLTEKAGLALEFKDLSEGVFCLLDEHQIKQALYSLISNAATYAPKGSVIQVVLKKSENRLAFSVTDQGSGIPDHVMSSIFSRYRRQEAAEDGRYGIGLGLVVVRAVAAAHEGTTMIQRLPEGGTRVTVTIPIRKSKDASFASQTANFVIHSTSDGLVGLSNVLPSEVYTPKKQS